MMEATIRATEQEEQSAKARRALERVCARGASRPHKIFNRSDFTDHVNRMDFRGDTGIRESVGIYHAIFPDLRIAVEDQVTEGNRVTSRWTMHGTLDRPRQLGLRRSAILGLRYVTGRLSPYGNRSSRA